MKFVSQVRVAACTASTLMISIAISIVSQSCAPPKERLNPDAGVPDNALYPTAVDPEEGEQDVFIDKVIRLTYSNPVDSSTLSQFMLNLHSGPVGQWVRFYYDPVRRQLVIWPSRSMRMDAVYMLEIEPGVLDIEGTPLAFGEILSFKTGEKTGDNKPYNIPSFKKDVLPIFEKYCASCHSSTGREGFDGLRLAGADELAKTAIGVDSKGWPGRKRILANEPGLSYLLYKVIGDKRIAGVAMPRTPDLERAAPSIPKRDQETLTDWIASGALFF